VYIFLIGPLPPYHNVKYNHADFNHKLDMGIVGAYWTHRMYEYNPDIVHDEVSKTWERIPDRRVAYDSVKYPWLVAAYRFHNKVNMHSDWDLVQMDLPARVFTDEHIAEKGQHYLVQYSSRSHTDYTYTDVIDVHVLQTPVDPPELIYGSSSGEWGWSKTDHCQFIEPAAIVSPIREATANVRACAADMEDEEMAKLSGVYGITVVPAANPDVVPNEVVRDIEEVDPVCVAGCTAVPTDVNVKTAGFCRLATADIAVAVCAAPARVHTVVWANPLLSLVDYDSATVSGAKPGDYIAFEWDDAIHGAPPLPFSPSFSSSIDQPIIICLPLPPRKSRCVAGAPRYRGSV
jgi:hypothetical protein